ncbi:MAG: multidrug efflux SMR transporter [Acidaminobacteraceae bacterium]
MEWIYLLLAGLLEVGWATGLKKSDGFSNWLPSLLTVLGMILSFYFLALALKKLPLGTAYAIWTGIGTVGTILLGTILFKEPISFYQSLCVLLIVGGISGLKLLT